LTTPQERSRILESGTGEFDNAVRNAVRRALVGHYRTDDPIAIWRDGGVVWIPPEEIPAFLEGDKPERESGPASDPSPVRAR
jgi:hypothetical protein